MHEVFFSVFGLAELLVKWGIGWRYVLSKTFRRQVHDQWARKSRRLAFLQALGYGVVFIAANFIALVYPVLAIVWLWQDVVLKHLAK